MVGQPTQSHALAPVQLVTQAEQKHAAAQQARARAAAAATALPAGNSSAPPPAGSEQVAAAPGIGAHIVGGGAPTAAPLPAAGAPPAPAQELAAAPGSMAPAAQQPPAASGDAQPAAPADAAGAPAAAPAAGTDGAQGSDSWGDEDDLDTEMLAEAEAAALRDRAERSLHGEPPGPSNRRSPPLPGGGRGGWWRGSCSFTLLQGAHSHTCCSSMSPTPPPFLTQSRQSTLGTHTLAPARCCSAAATVAPCPRCRAAKVRRRP